jgi:hypothetical protein
MISYKDFETEIRQHTADFEQWQHILPSVPHELRERYIAAIKDGVHMPDAFDYVLLTQKLPDETFYNLLMKRREEE